MTQDKDEIEVEWDDGEMSQLIKRVVMEILRLKAMLQRENGPFGLLPGNLMGLMGVAGN